MPKILSVLVVVIAASLWLPGSSGGATAPAPPSAAGRVDSPAAVPAASPRKRAAISKEKAEDLVWALPEVKAWAQFIREKTKGKVSAVTMVEPEAPETIEGKRYWSVNFYENQPEYLHRWQSFMVRLDGKEILVDTEVPDVYLSLQEWRTKEHPLERIREPKRH